MDLARVRRILGHRRYQHNRLDRWLLTLGTGAQRAAINGHRRRRRPDLSSHRRHRWLAGLAPTPRLHRAVSRVVGNARRLLAGAQQDHDRADLARNPDVSEWKTARVAGVARHLQRAVQLFASMRQLSLVIPPSRTKCRALTDFLNKVLGWSSSEDYPGSHHWAEIRVSTEHPARVCQR